LTVLQKEAIDTDSGEIIYDDYETDDFKAGKNRKIKTVKKFCAFYEPLYKKKMVSLLFYTFTRMDHAKKDMKSMLECVKIRYKALKTPIRGYLWALEVSENNHVHYHLVLAIDRIRVKEIPEKMKLEGLWGQRTGVEFIKKSVKAYLTKYLYKGDARVLGCRTYAISRKLV
jgi:hypothetical protein